jgi:anion-transporting  ArsA/GET3 family ATPase
VSTPDPFSALVEQRHVLVCCGTGGVGKTTTAAVLALEGARRGRRSVVVTIDPARRLANTLGLDELSNEPHEIDRAQWDPAGDAPESASVSALMLDTKSTFDALVWKYAATEEQAERILANRFYRNISGALGGTQEYMAMEKLHELDEDGSFDLIVVDTPPTRHALEFLDAPARLTRMLDNRIFRLLMVPTRVYLRVASVAVTSFLRTVSRVVGSEVIDDIVSFFRAFEGMEEGFRSRAQGVQDLLADHSTGFVLVTTPGRDAVEESSYFANKLSEHDIGVAALVVNRIHPRFGTERPEGLRARAATLAGMAESDDPEVHAAATRLHALYANLADFVEVAERELGHVAGVRERVGFAAVGYVPYLPRDVHDFEALEAVGRLLFGGSPSAVVEMDAG